MTEEDLKELLVELYITYGDREFSLDEAEKHSRGIDRMRCYKLEYLGSKTPNHIHLTPKAIALIKEEN